MTATSAVADGKLTNDELGRFTRRCDEIKRRLNEGTLMFPLVMGGLQSIIEGRLAVRDFPIWKTLKLGIHKTALAYRTAMKEAGLNIGSWADGLLGSTFFTTCTMETEVDLVVASVAELGFKGGAKYSEICARAKELGLELCPAEVGPALRLAYKDQPKGEWLIIAMEAITDSDSGLDVFGVEHYDGGLWLLSNHGNPVIFWVGYSRFVFVRRK